MGGRVGSQRAERHLDARPPLHKKEKRGDVRVDLEVCSLISTDANMPLRSDLFNMTNVQVILSTTSFKVEV